MNTKLTMTLGDWLLLVILSTLWGGSFFFAEIAVREIPPLTLALGRCAIAALVLFVYVRAVGMTLPASAAIWLPLAVLASLNTVLPFSLIFWGQTHIPSGLAAILNATAPLFSILIAHFATTDERLTSRRALGVGIGFVGVVIVIGIDALLSLGLNVLAQLAVVLAAFCYASAGVYGRRFKSHPPAVIAAAVLLLGSLMLLPLAAFVEQPWRLPAPSAVAIACMAGLAVISTALAFLIYFRVLARAGATNFQLVAFMIPVSAILLGAGFLGEVLEWRHFVGMALIAAGLATIDGRPERALRRFLLRGA
jgi:drug/metabolite transporter (DMT)-like permease